MNAVVESTDIVKGIDPRMPWDQYLATQGLSITRLKELKRSPLHYRYRLTHQKESRPLSLGRAAHCAVLEPDRYERDHAVWTRRTDSGNLAPRNGKHWEAFRAENEGRSIITEDENDEALGMQEAIRADADAMRYLAHGFPEVTMRWPLFGRQAKGRADWHTFIESTPAVVGLKSAIDCRLFQFSSAAARFGYHLQWAYYHDGYETITRIAPRMVEIVVESKPPHAVVVYQIPNEIILQGRDEYMELMKLLDECERDNHWPGPAVGEQVLSLPSWVYGQQSDDLADLGLEVE